MNTPEQTVVWAIGTCLAGAVLTLAVARWRTFAGWVAFAVTAASGGLVAQACTRVLLHGPAAGPVTVATLPWLGSAVRLHIDGLSCIFLLLCVVIAAPAALYSIAYLRHYPEYGVGRYYPNFLLFVGAIYALLSTTDTMWVFFAVWQLMTLPGFMLVRFEKEKRENVRAAYKYLLMMEIACAAVLAGTWLLVDKTAGSALRYDFYSVSEHLPQILVSHPVVAAVAFALMLVGFGIKAGMWPFGQIWLPDAHPAAPSPVSAMLSGVMIKTGVYGLIRTFLWLVPSSAASLFPMRHWGTAVAVLGTITLFTGTAAALHQGRTKRLLAYSSIGQVGYMLFAVGTCMVLVAARPNLAAVAALALTGALFHILNHGVFKGLLFLNAGAMLTATGTQDMDRMGGLARFMPMTALTALIASFSISGVPLFSGFASKWTIYVAAFQGSTAAPYLAICAAVAILTSAITLALFIKFFGACFLSRASRLVKDRAEVSPLEAPWQMQAPQLFLAGICVLVGVVPLVGLQVVGRALSHIEPGTVAASLSGITPVNAHVSGIEFLHSTAYMPISLLVIMAVMFGLSFLISRIGDAPQRKTQPWLCGYATESDNHRYAARNFYGELKGYLRWPSAKASAGRPS